MTKNYKPYEHPRWKDNPLGRTTGFVPEQLSKEEQKERDRKEKEFMDGVNDLAKILKKND
ncbi:hypothetical protein BN424_1854 [Carnobacterium maltaromaticum LMA28]|uniref:Uncharacterized protein n=1 Tax=Carnobacterium maltaromaticum LMA28 TaxID=1234679 RepID=K8E4D5_CARML|nr:hypothetical protein [Carnobacterium maltaromaticum]CCO11295.2 hypothetical protein BN424_1854 [Carnobacterium maltaromaticum LMA28]